MPPPSVTTGVSTRTKKISAAVAVATALAIPAEGLYQVAYYDPPGILTVCYGSTTNVEKNKVYSLQECKDRLSAEMTQAVAHVDRCHPNLPPNVLAAFGDAVYNLGPKIACNPKASTASRLLSVGQYAQACNQLPRWNKAVVMGVLIPLPGLTTRREKERQVCLTGLAPQTL